MAELIVTTSGDIAPVLFNVEHVTRAGVQVVARDLWRRDAEAYLELARVERVPGRCVRVVLAVRAKPLALKLQRATGAGTGARRWPPLSEAARARIMAEAETES